MSVIRAVLFASLAIGFVLTPLVATPTLAGNGSVHPAGQSLAASPSNETNESTEVSLGSRISGFMQQQSSQASGTVESGMWEGAFGNTSDNASKAALIEQRTSRLQSELETIEQEKQALVEARQQGEISQLEFQSRMSGLVGRYVSLLDAVNRTRPRAERAGVNASAVEALRGAAKRAAGPELSAAANNRHAVVPPGLTTNGTGSQTTTPANAASGGNANPGNGAAGTGAIGNGQPGNSGNGNHSNQGAPGNSPENRSLAENGQPVGQSLPGNATVPGLNGDPVSGVNLSVPGLNVTISGSFDLDASGRASPHAAL